MSTTVSRRIAATFQGGRDPDQDQIVEWLKTLPISDKGNVERSVMKYHITRALLSYIQSGTSLQPKPHISQVVPVVSAVADVVIPATVNARAPVSEPARVAPVYSEPALSVSPVPVMPPVAVVPPVIKPKGTGSLLRNKIAKSMNSGT